MSAALRHPVATPAAQPAPTASARGVLRFITCGSVDDGKSTLIGRILYEAGAVFEDQLAALDRDSARFGTTGGSRDFALLVDGLAAEREQGITIDVAYRYFATPKRHFIVADTPGHEQYTRNMATGASTADAAILLIDARRGLLPQTRRHSFIVATMGVRQVIVAINKMDLVGFDEAVFRRIETDYRAAVAGLGFEQITCIPVVARDGDNLTTHSLRMPWYRGPSLLPLLETLDPVPRGGQKAGFAMPVQWVSRPNADFRGFAGTIASGTVRPGDVVQALPSGKRSRIKRIVTADGDLPQAVAGQAVTIVLTDEIDLSRGDVLTAATATPGQKLPQSLRELTADVIITAERPVMAGSQFLLKLGTHTVQATVTSIVHVTDVESYARRPTDQLTLNAIGQVRLRLDRPLVVQDYALGPVLGGFILIDRRSNETVAFGFVRLSALPAPPPPLRRAMQWLSITLLPVEHRVAGRFWPHASERLLQALISAGLVLAATQRPLLALSVIGADLALRPILMAAHAALWARRQPKIGALIDGDGI